MAPSELKSKIVEITPSVAKEMLTKNKHNRPMKPGAVRKFAEIIESGDWLLTNDAISFDTRGNLCNGQHRLSACVVTDKPIECLIVYGVSPKAFAVMDTGNLRSAKDVLAIDKAENPGELATALRLLDGRLQGRGFLSGKVSNLHLMQVLQDHPEINDSVEFLVKLNKDKDGILKQLGNIGNFACLHYLMRASDIDKCKSLAKEFFEILANMEEEGKERAPIRLRMKLLTDKKSVSPLSRDAKIGIIVKAFLAFANDEKVQTLSVQKGEYPVLGGLDMEPVTADPEPEPEPEATEKAPKPKKKKKKKVVTTVAEEESAPVEHEDEGPPPESE